MNAYPLFALVHGLEVCSRRTALVGVLLVGSAVQPLMVQATLSGRVSNAATKNNLEGARVEIQGRGLVTYTDSEGVYRFAGVELGVVKVAVSYTGLDTAVVPITLGADGAAWRDVALSSDVYVMGQYVVAGEREGNSLAITLQRQAMNVKNVVSSDAFGTLAGNPADLAVRVPGVVGEWVGGDIRFVRIRGLNHQLSTVTMDGNRMADAASAGATREYQFQQIGSDAIERVEVTKSPTPDMGADSIGGAINMVSKSAFDRSPERRLSGSIGGISHLTDDRDEVHPNFSIAYSEVFRGKLGVSLNYGHRAHNSLFEGTTQNWQNKPDDPAYVYSFQALANTNIRTRWGGGLRLDYKSSEQTRFFFNTSINRHNEQANRDQATYSTAQTVATRNAAGELTGTGTILPEYTSRSTEWRPLNTSLATISAFTNHKQGDARHFQLGAVHSYRGLRIDYDAYRSKSVANYPGNWTFNFIARGVGMRIDRTGEPFFPRITQTAGPDITNIASYTENSLVKDAMTGIDRYFGVAVNVKKDFRTPVPTFLKVGARLRQQDRDLSDRGATYTSVGPDGVMGLNPATRVNDDNLAQFVRPVIGKGIHGDLYPRVPYPSFPNRHRSGTAPDWTGPNIITALTERPHHFREDIALNTRTPLLGYQLFDEEIRAAYLMGSVELGRLTALGGLRVEETATSGEGALTHVSPEERARRAAWVGPVTDDELRRRTMAEFSGRKRAAGEYRDVYPGIHFKYEAARGLLLRASYATNIGRPSIGQLIPNTTVNDDNRTVASSNPSLKPQYAGNFDLAVEYYFEPAGLVSAGVFLKEIEDFIFTAGGNVIGSGADNGFDGRYEGYTLTTQRNGGSARVRGLELNYQQQFNFLSGWMKGFGAFANYTRLETKGDYGGAATRSTNEVAGFTPEIANLGVFYIRQPITLRVHYNHAGRYLQTFNASQARLLYRTGRSTVDLKTVYNVSRRFDVYFDVINVFREPDRALMWYNERPQTIQDHRPMFYFGVNARL